MPTLWRCTDETLRRAFQRVLGTSPQEYRDRFGRRGPPGAGAAAPPP